MNTMNKRNRQKVQDAKWDKKTEKGRIVKEQRVEKELLPPITAKTSKQRALFKALHNKTLVVASGSAGTGKTYCSVGDASDALKRGDIDKIILARPYVGMGRAMGFRPGSETDKLMPFMLPMIDVISQRIGKNTLTNQMELGNIELCPIETIRGRSFNDSICIVDEVQNTTIEEIKSILTRIGENSQLILLGDPKQSDINGKNGLEWVCEMIHKYEVEDAEVVHFDISDVVRSDMCSVFLRIIEWESELS